MAKIKQPPFIDEPKSSDDRFWSLSWFEWLRDIWSRINERPAIGDAVAGDILTLDDDGDLTASDETFLDDTDVLEIVEEYVTDYTGERYLTENLLPEAGTESGHHLGNRYIEGDLLVDGYIEASGHVSAIGNIGGGGTLAINGETYLGNNTLIDGNLEVEEIDTSGIPWVSERFITENLLPEAGTEPGNHFGSYFIGDGTNGTFFDENGDISVSSTTASRLLATDASKTFVSIDLDDWVAGTANQITITDDGDGSVTASLPAAIYIPDDQIFGLGAAKGRIEFNDDVPNTIKFLGCEVEVGDYITLDDNGSINIEGPFSKQPRFTLDNTNDDVFSAQINFWKLPATLSDDDQLGYIGAYCIRHSQPQAYIDFRIADETVDHTGGEMNFGCKVDDTTVYMLRLKGYNGTVGEAEVVFNDSAVDIDFIIRKKTTGNAIVYDAGNDTTSIGDGGVTNYAQFAADGELTLVGTARVWKCRELEPGAVKLPGVNPPAEAVIDYFPFHRYDKATEESSFFHWGVPDDFATGTANVRGNFRFVVENPPAGGGANVNVRMGFEYKKITEGDVFTFAGASSGYVDETIVAGETALTTHHTAFGTCDTTGWVHGDTILFRFYRDATAVEDTYDDDGPAENDVWVWNYHLEYLSDRLGAAS